MKRLVFHLYVLLAAALMALTGCANDRFPEEETSSEHSHLKSSTEEPCMEIKSVSMSVGTNSINVSWSGDPGETNSGTCYSTVQVSGGGISGWATSSGTSHTFNYSYAIPNYTSFTATVSNSEGMATQRFMYRNDTHTFNPYVGCEYTMGTVSAGGYYYLFRDDNQALKMHVCVNHEPFFHDGNKSPHGYLEKKVVVYPNGFSASSASYSQTLHSGQSDIMEWRYIQAPVIGNIPFNANTEVCVEIYPYSMSLCSEGTLQHVLVGRAPYNPQNLGTFQFTFEEIYRDASGTLFIPVTPH
ncbi:MAG: hypothetical protein LBL04_07805 [Bacteroidales bacterium]|jgi:hypothetical protein|nr:hypothetical protein [Bacteroidales bacterium]